jgi:hypothetical protein
MLRLGSTMRTGLRFVQRSHSERANVASSMVTWRNRGVLDRRGANEADFSVIIVVGFGGCHRLRNCRQRFALLIRHCCWRFAFVRCSPATACPTFSASPPASSTASLRGASASASRPKLLVGFFLAALRSPAAPAAFTSSSLRARRLRIFLCSSCASRSHGGVSCWVVWWYKSGVSREMEGKVVRKV